MKNKKDIYIGNIKSSFLDKEVKGEQIKVNDESFYKISNVDSMRPFS